MSDPDHLASPAAAGERSYERSIEEIVRRYGLDLDEIARREAEDVAAGRVRPHDEVMAELSRIAARRNRPGAVPVDHED